MLYEVITTAVGTIVESPIKTLKAVLKANHLSERDITYLNQLRPELNTNLYLPIDSSFTIDFGTYAVIFESNENDVCAANDGKISYAGNNNVSIEHYDDVNEVTYYTLYEGLSDIYVKTGDEVSRESVIGKAYPNPSSDETSYNFV